MYCALVLYSVHALGYLDKQVSVSIECGKVRWSEVVMILCREVRCLLQAFTYLIRDYNVVNVYRK